MAAPPDRPWVAYVGPFPYPEGSAASRRVLGVAESLSLAGFDVVVASGAGQSTGSGVRLVAQADGISYCLLPERVAEHWPRPLRRFRYAAMGGRTLAWLASQPTLPEAVILYSGYTPYLRHLLPWCRRNGVRLLFDAVEWYEPAHPLGYLTSPYQWNIEWAMRRLVPLTDGVIAISSYLADYYRKRGLPVAIVPPTTSAIGAGQWRPDARLRLCYAGNPGNKDDLALVLRAVARLVSTGAAIHLTVAGPERSQVLGMLGEPPGRELPWLHAPGMLRKTPAGDVREAFQLFTTGEVTALGVHPAGRRQGHGSRLLNAGVDHLTTAGAEQLSIWILVDDEQTRAFLTGAGFAPDGAYRDRVVSADGEVLREVRLSCTLSA